MKGPTANLEISSKKRRDERQDVMLRLYADDIMKRIQTGVAVFKSDFNRGAKFGFWVRQTDSACIKKNEQLKEIKLRAEGAPVELAKQGILPTIDNTIKYLRGNINSSIGKETNFIPYCKKLIVEKKATEPVNTWKKYHNFMNKFLLFLGSTILNFSDINVALVNDFESYLKKLGNATNTRQKELKCLRALLYRAMKDGLFPQERNPFFQFKIKSAKTDKTKLTEEEIKQIQDLKLPVESSLWHTRNYFMFSFFCAGIRFGDVIQLKWSDIKNGYLYYRMNKTGEFKVIKLIPQTLLILSYYEKNKESEDDFIFPLLDRNLIYTDKFFLNKKKDSKNTITNKNLKKIAKLIGLKKILSYHCSRHSFANLARKKHMGLYDISKALGHSSIKVTETYLQSMDQDSLDESMGKMFKEDDKITPSASNTI
jgi:integrase